MFLWFTKAKGTRKTKAMINDYSATANQPQGKRPAVNKTPYTLFLNKAMLMVVLLLAVTLSSCGYKMGTSFPSVVGDGTNTLKVKDIDYPTLDSWLPYSIRSSLRDEINARKLARWVDSDPADYEISIKVKSYTSREWLTNRKDETILYETSLSLEAIVYNGQTNKEVWRSGTLSYSERQDSATGERKGTEEIITQIMRQLCDKMRNTF